MCSVHLHGKQWLPVILTAALLLMDGIRSLRSLPVLPTPCEWRAAAIRILSALHSPLLAEALNHSTAFIPAGEFWMGSDTGHADEHPMHRVYLDAYSIDCFEVTNLQYAEFIHDTGISPPAYWNEVQFPTGSEVVPVVGVSQEDAGLFCAWAKKRLPTEAEWEKAARGLDHRTYPWGEQWDFTKANVFAGEISSFLPAGVDGQVVWDLAWQLLKEASAQKVLPALKPVGSYPRGQSPYGVMDMAGNASEWIADWYNWGDYSTLPDRNPRVNGPMWNHVVRGSAWIDPTGGMEWVKDLSRTSARNSSHVSSDPRIGFRCVQSTDP